MELTTTFELRTVQDGFRAMSRQAESRARAFFETIKPEAKADLRARQQERRGPRGEAWPARATATVQRGKRGGKRRARSRNRALLGRLPRAWNSQVASDELKMTNRARIAEAHDRGASVGHGAQLPARPFIGWSPGFVADAADLWAEHVLEGWENK